MMKLKGEEWHGPEKAQDVCGQSGEADGAWRDRAKAG